MRGKAFNLTPFGNCVIPFVFGNVHAFFSGDSENHEKNKKLVKTLKINKLLICVLKMKLRKKTRQNVENKQTFDLSAKPANHQFVF